MSEVRVGAAFAALGFAFTSGCLLVSDLDATPQAESTGSSSPTATNATSTADGASTAASGATTTEGSAATTTGTGGGGGVACEPADFADPPPGEGGGGGEGGGAGGCALGTRENCMACGHDCGGGSTCDEGRCKPANLGAVAYTTSALGIGGGYVLSYQFEASQGVHQVFRYPIDADGVTQPDPGLASSCEPNELCAERLVATAPDGAAYVGSPTGLLECPTGEPCVAVPEVMDQDVTGLSWIAGSLWFARSASSQPDLAMLDLGTRQLTTLVDSADVRGAVAFARRGEQTFLSAVLADSGAGALLRRDASGGVATLARGTAAAGPLGIASDGESVYWREGDAVMRLASGCEPEVLIASSGFSHRHIDVDSTFIYFDYGPDLHYYRCDKRAVSSASPDETIDCDDLARGSHFVADDTWVIIAAAGAQLQRVRKAP